MDISRSIAENLSSARNPAIPQTDTFWTLCSKCKIRFEYLVSYRNRNLRCRECSSLFRATEIQPPPPGRRNLFTQCPPLCQQKQSDSGTQFPLTQNMGTSGLSSIGSVASRASVPQDSSSKSDGARNVTMSAGAADQPAFTSQSTGESLNRGHEGVITVAVDKEVLQKKSAEKTGAEASESGSRSGKREGQAKKRRVKEYKANVPGDGMVNQIFLGGGVSGQANTSGSQMSGSEKEKVIVSGSNAPKSSRRFSLSATRNMLMQKAKMEIHVKLNRWDMINSSKSSTKECKNMEKAGHTLNAAQESVVSGLKKEGNATVALDKANKSVKRKKSSLSSETTNSVAKAIKISVPDPDELKKPSLSAAPKGSVADVSESIAMSVPDPDFFDFDKDRTEESFGKNQVWAVYDNEDGMPRYYAVVRGLISKPFEVRFSWLNCKSNDEFGLLNWVGRGFTKTCGNFRRGRSELKKTLNCFSHKVTWTKGPGGVIQIFPRKEDVWALYRNWSSNWNENTPNELIQKYDMVEVLEDYNEERGVPVALLLKVVGFKSVFHKHPESKIFTIPREEMFRFSHQVPSYILTGQEAEKVPKGSWELDPAAMPLELLEVMTEAKAGEVEEAVKVGVSGSTADRGEDKRASKNCMGKGKKVVGVSIEGMGKKKQSRC